MGNKETVVLLTGAGASIDFGIPSTHSITNQVREVISTKHPEMLSLLQKIEVSLANYLINPDTFNFEDVYNSIIDLYIFFSKPKQAAAFNEFRPRLYATHTIADEFSCFNEIEINMLEFMYIQSIADILLENNSNAHKKEIIISALSRIKESNNLFSFTLNYDTLIDESIGEYSSGFDGNNYPKKFNANSLINSINEKKTVHCHLHGSIKYGFTIASGLSIEELETAKEGNKSIKGPSGRPNQNGSTIPPRTIITGLAKTEQILNEPFATNNFAFKHALFNCDNLVIVGYGFTDKHINKAIEGFRKGTKKNVYIVDFKKHNNPRQFFEEMLPDGWQTIQPCENMRQFVYQPSGEWHEVQGINSKPYSHGNLYIWLKGAQSFFVDVAVNGLPK